MSITLKKCANSWIFFFLVIQSCKILRKAEDLQLSNRQNPERRQTTTTQTETCSEYKTLTQPRINHLQNVFIDPRVLRVDAAISYLAVLVPEKEKTKQNKKRSVVEIWNVVEISAHTGRLKR